MMLIKLHEFHSTYENLSNYGWEKNKSTVL